MLRSGRTEQGEAVRSRVSRLSQFMLLRHHNYAVFKWERLERQGDMAVNHRPGINGTFKPSQPLVRQGPTSRSFLSHLRSQCSLLTPPRLVNMKLTSIKRIVSHFLLVQAKLAYLLPSCLVFLNIGIICYLGWIYCRRTLLINVTLLWRDKTPQNA